MNKREEIEAVIQAFEDDSPDAGYGYEKGKMAQAILEKLHSQGCVWKTGRGLPDKWRMVACGNGVSMSPRLLSPDYIEGYEEAQKEMLDAGYVAVAPLLEDTAKLASKK